MMGRREVVQTTLWLTAMGVIEFASAGDWFWPQAWVFLGESGVSAFVVGSWLARHDPALLKSRTSSPFHRDQGLWDRLFMIGAGIAFVGWLVLACLDARRFPVVFLADLGARTGRCFDRGVHDPYVAGIPRQQFRRAAGADPGGARAGGGDNRVRTGWSAIRCTSPRSSTLWAFRYCSDPVGRCFRFRCLSPLSARGRSARNVCCGSRCPVTTRMRTRSGSDLSRHLVKSQALTNGQALSDSGRNASSAGVVPISL